MTVNSKELDVIRKRAEAATPGPWFAEAANTADAEFIAHARQDVPKLLAEIERLKLDNDTLRGNIKTIETLTKCKDTKDFAKRALAGDATIRI
jgi:regulator of replication initiation timing